MKNIRNSWNKLSSKNYIFYDEYFQNIRSFPATNQIASLLFKIPKILENKINPNSSKIEYKQKREVYQKRVQRCFNKMKIAYLNNLLLMSKLTESINATFVAGFLPEIRSSKKIHIKNEINEIFNIKNNFTALSDQELKEVDTLPNYRLFQKRFEDRIQYNKNILMIKDEVNLIAKKNNFFILDLMPYANKAPKDLELFPSSIHFTNDGSEYLMKSSIDQILKIIKSTSE